MNTFGLDYDCSRKLQNIEQNEISKEPIAHFAEDNACIRDPPLHVSFVQKLIMFKKTKRSIIIFAK